jgi:hypothetical protein
VWYLVGMGNVLRLGAGVGLIVAALSGCDREPSKLDQLIEGSTLSSSSPAPPPRPDASAMASTSPGDAAVSSDASAWDGAMPPRPIPKPALTVGSGMDPEIQMKAIAYMAAMEQPRFDDANADPDYAGKLAEQLKPILLAFDKGTPEEKLRLNRVVVVASGRRIDLLMADGCDARAPQLTVQRAAASFMTLLSHGVVVIRCNDARVQCLQSTREPTDVLCTTAPRHQ